MLDMGIFVYKDDCRSSPISLICRVLAHRLLKHFVVVSFLEVARAQANNVHARARNKGDVSIAALVVLVQAPKMGVGAVAVHVPENICNVSRLSSCKAAKVSMSKGYNVIEAHLTQA